MIFFNWSKIYVESDGLPNKILDIIAYLTFKPIAENNYDTHILRMSSINWSGISYLVNPKSILINRKKVSEDRLAEYVALASFRNYNNYKVTKQATLSIYECPISLDSLKNNKLLTIQNDQIYFCWEEVLQ